MQFDQFLILTKRVFSSSFHVWPFHRNYRQIWEQDKEAFIRRYASGKKNQFQRDIQHYRDLQSEIQSADSVTSAKFIRVEFGQLKQALIHHCVLWQQRFTALLHSNANTELSSLHSMFLAHTASLQRIPETLDMLGHSITLLRKIQADLPQIEARFEPLDEMYKLLDRFDVHVPEEEKEMFDNLRYVIVVFLSCVWFHHQSYDRLFLYVFNSFSVRNGWTSKRC